MNPYLFEEIYKRLGEPKWFWPAVFVMVLVLFFVAGSDE